MRDDFELIVRKLGRDVPYINVYPMCEPHIGNPYFNLELWEKWLDVVKSDPYGFVVSTGDNLDTALKTSKSNSYDATIRPRDQKKFLVKSLEPIKNRIIGMCQGNHEKRSSVLTDDCPLYDAMAKLDIEDLYRENMAFIKISLGDKSKERQFAYTMVLAHGASRNKVGNFSYAIDNMDVLVTGHTHTGASEFPAKYVIDVHNETVSKRGFKRVVVPSFQDGKGYALSGMYSPQDNNIFPVIRFDGTKKGVDVKWLSI